MKFVFFFNFSNWEKFVKQIGEIIWWIHYKMIVAFYRFMPQAILRAVIAHMELTDPDELENLLSNKPDFVIQSTDKQRLAVISLFHIQVFHY